MKKVLIVDDASFMRMSIRTILENNGFEVVGEAENGVVGVSKYKELLPDVVTMDITMPQMDGIQTLKAIMEFNPKAKVIMICALDQEFRIREAILNGAKSFIIKPFIQEHVVKTLSNL